ncbi:ribose-phosphate pyrophosphokinase [Candidatus Pacearchaeota archaeon]|nr:ribose-phosphate pyrophosphokinase [Candidatus Pacearchaeota archaeon]
MLGITLQFKSRDFAEKIHSYIINEKKLDFPLRNIDFWNFKNGEMGAYVPENVRKKRIYFIHDSTKEPSRWWVELLLVKDLLLSASAESVTFVLPNMLYSRQDRKDKPHVPISARAFARSISPGLERIITMELHAPQLQGFYPENVPVDNLFAFPEVVRYLRANHYSYLNNLVVVSPDLGSAQRTRAFLSRLEKAQEKDGKKQEYFFAICNKERIKHGEVDNVELIVGDVEVRNVFFLDDMIDSGGTLCKAAETLKMRGAKKLLCYGTHAMFSDGTEKLLKTFDIVMTSNTHNKKYHGVETIDVSPIFAEAIYRAYVGESISELFDTRTNKA